MLMRLSASTSGVKVSVTPKGLNSIPIGQTRVLMPAVTVQSWLLGTGISPPAVNFAVSPEIAVSVGSARTRETPARSKARSVAVVKALPPRVVPLMSVSDRICF